MEDHGGSGDPVEEGSGSGEGEDPCQYPSEAEIYLLRNVVLYLGGYGLIVVAVIGIVTNILAIAVFSQRAFKSNFNNLLVALAVFDLLFLFIMITESVKKNFMPRFGEPGSITSIHHLIWPHGIFPLMNILLTSSVYMTVSISVERFVAIFFPMMYKTNNQGGNCSRSSILCHILPVILLSVLINLPTFFASKVEVVDAEFLDMYGGHFDPANLPAINSTTIGVTWIRKHPAYAIGYQNWARFLLLGLVPSLLLVVLNLSVFLAIQRRRSTCRDASYAHILLLIVLVFLLCQSPRLFLNFWELTLDPFCGPPAWFDMLHELSKWLIALNSAINFFIYCLAGAKFRQGLGVMLGCRRAPRPGPPSTSHTAVDLKSYTTKL